MPLTVKEKEHWKERIEMKIDKAIEKIFREAGKGVRLEVRQEAESRVVKQHGLEDYMRQYAKLEARLKELRKQQDTLEAEAAKPFAAEKQPGSWPRGHTLIEAVIEKEAKEVEKEILQESEFGRRVLQLEREREELTDTIWLATSPVQIRSLWKDFTTMVTEEPTQLQKQALTYKPDDESE